MPRNCNNCGEFCPPEHYVFRRNTLREKHYCDSTCYDEGVSAILADEVPVTSNGFYRKLPEVPRLSGRRPHP